MLKSLLFLFSSNPLYGLTLNKKKIRDIPRYFDPWEGEETVGHHLLSSGIQAGGRFIPLEDFEYMLGSHSIVENPTIHSFEWLRHLKKLGHNMSRKMARQFISTWIAGHKGIGGRPWRHWNLGILGYRISNWIALYDFFGTSADENFRNVFLKSLSQQVSHLSRATLYNLPSQEKWMALKGLLMAMPHNKNYLLKFEATVAELIREDGGHKDLSWQLIALRDLIDIRQRLSLKEGVIINAIDRMAGAIRFLRNSDGLLCPLVQNPPFWPTSSHTVDMILSIADSHLRPPIAMPQTGIEKIQSSLGIFFIQSRHLKKPIISGGIGALDWVWTPQHLPLLMSDVYIEPAFKDAPVLMSEKDVVCETRCDKSSPHRMLWQGRMKKDGSTIQRDLSITRQSLQGSETLIGDEPEKARNNGRLWVRFHVSANVEHLEEPGHFKHHGQTWKLKADKGKLEISKSGRYFKIGNTASEGVRWTLSA